MSEDTCALLKTPTGELLEAFAAGSHMPGAGSAAALMGLLAGKLIVSVGKLSLRKPTYQDRHGEIERLVGAVAGRIEPELRRLFERDSVIFDEVIALRRARDAEADEGKRAAILAQLETTMRDATEIPFRICELCVELVDLGTAMFDAGLVAGRGDSGAAISAAAGGAMSGIFILGSNLDSFEPSGWLNEQQTRYRDLQRTLADKQRQGFGRAG